MSKVGEIVDDVNKQMRQCVLSVRYIKAAAKETVDILGVIIKHDLMYICCAQQSRLDCC